MVLEFVPEGNNYVAETIVKGSFNLYVELEEVGQLVVFKKPVDGGEYSCLHLHPNPLLIFDLNIENQFGERRILIRVAKKVVKATLVELNNVSGSGSQGGGGDSESGCNCNPEMIEAMRKELAEIIGKDPNSMSAQTLNIDNLKEIYNFLSGFTSKQTLEDVVPKKMSDTKLQSIVDLIK